MDIETIKRNFKNIINGYQWKSAVDDICTKNLDAYTGDVVSKTYLPRYSAREPELDYDDRMARAENDYMNFPEKIVNIYQNSLFRSGEPIRTGKSKQFQKFIKNCDGAQTTISDFIKDQVFVLHEIHGGCFVVIDKPAKPDDDTLSKYEQEKLEFYPYAYTYSWLDLVNFGVDRYKRLDWILFAEETTNEKGEKTQQYRYFDKKYWAVFDKDGNYINDQKGEHGLNEVPVIVTYSRRNVKHRFITPVSPLNDVVRLSLKIFETQSQLGQMIVSHAYMKLAMPKSMYEELKKEGFGNLNVFVFPDDETQRAYYIESQMSEIKQMIDLIYQILPDKILYFATIRDKTSMPREESGEAKWIDSADELSNLLGKAQQMETVEREMVRLALKWEGITNDDISITYNKVFDIKSINEQISEVVQIFKEDLGSPEFGKEIVKRLMYKMLGNPTEEIKYKIEKDLEYMIDPSLSLDDVDKVIRLGIINAQKLARKYNPDLRDKKDNEIDAFIQENLKKTVGVNNYETDNINA